MAFRLQSLTILAALLIGVTVVTASALNVTSGEPIVSGGRDLPHHLNSWIGSILDHLYKRMRREHFEAWDMVLALFAVCGLVQAYKIWRQSSDNDRARQSSAGNSFEKHSSSDSSKNRGGGSSKLYCIRKTL